jgi:hypothetical protein
MQSAGPIEYEGYYILWLSSFYPRKSEMTALEKKYSINFLEFAVHMSTTYRYIVMRFYEVLVR